ncbi:hypothetical protein [Stenotrophomonas maltophilia]|uniref:hypothetical protein n=1 Tax=Stenotrophomonas maltophilia TaxID=40324 RepID=UPI00240E2D88|nr:hypothetical protein [Stenotrophomonas maltophilia]MDG2508661.1 hypothetical protein [Stenotrophomonas maltophilia]
MKIKPIAALFLLVGMTACTRAGHGDQPSSNTDAMRAVAEANAAAAEAEQAVKEAQSSAAGLCKSQSEAAERTMIGRLQGTAMSDAMDRAKQLGEPYVSYVREAYDAPRVSSQAAQDHLTQAFRDEAYARCMKQWGI